MIRFALISLATVIMTFATCCEADACHRWRHRRSCTPCRPSYDAQYAGYIVACPVGYDCWCCNGTNWIRCAWLGLNCDAGTLACFRGIPDGEDPGTTYGIRCRISGLFERNYYMVIQDNRLVKFDAQVHSEQDKIGYLPEGFAGMMAKKPKPNR